MRIPESNTPKLSICPGEHVQLQKTKISMNKGCSPRMPYLNIQVKLWSSQLWAQFLQLRREVWKIQDFNGIWTRDLAIPVRRSNQLSYEVTDIGSWSFVGSNGPVRNESIMKWYIWNESYMNCGYENLVRTFIITVIIMV